jgi:hypothetical protein
VQKLHGTFSVWRTAVEQMTVSLFGHPASAGEVAFPGPARTLGFMCWIDVQNDPRHLLPVGAFGIRVEES